MSSKPTIVLLIMSLCLLAVSEEKQTETKVLREDRGQTYFTTKVYELKHVSAANIQPFVAGAVKRNNVASNTNAIAYRAGNKELLIVTMDRNIVKMVDDMIAKLDRGPQDEKKQAPQIIGTGITRGVYRPRYRSTEGMRKIIATIVEDEGEVFRDPKSNMIYWNSSDSKNQEVLKLLGQLDREVPQVELKVMLHRISRSALTTVGIDFEENAAAGVDGTQAGVVLDAEASSKLSQLIAIKASQTITATGSVIVNNLARKTDDTTPPPVYVLDFSPYPSVQISNCRVSLEVKDQCSASFTWAIRSTAARLSSATTIQAGTSRCVAVFESTTNTSSATFRHSAVTRHTNDGSAIIAVVIEAKVPDKSGKLPEWAKKMEAELKGKE